MEDVAEGRDVLTGEDTQGVVQAEEKHETAGASGEPSIPAEESAGGSQKKHKRQQKKAVSGQLTPKKSQKGSEPAAAAAAAAAVAVREEQQEAVSPGGGREDVPAKVRKRMSAFGVPRLVPTRPSAAYLPSPLFDKSPSAPPPAPPLLPSRLLSQPVFLLPPAPLVLLSRSSPIPTHLITLICSRHPLPLLRPHFRSCSFSCCQPQTTAPTAKGRKGPSTGWAH